MWVENLQDKDRKILNMIAGNLELPELKSYASMSHFLTDVYSRISEAGSLARQLSTLLNT